MVFGVQNQPQKHRLLHAKRELFHLLGGWLHLASDPPAVGAGVVFSAVDEVFWVFWDVQE